VVTYETDKTATTVSLMSLNLQNNNNNADVAGTLSTRLGTVAELITAEKPDSVGVQECDVVGTLNMRSTLNTALENSGYQCVLEETTEGGGYAFKNFIWVNADTTKVISSGEAWLSETPTVPSKGFGTPYYISMGWAVLENIATGEQYVHVNTHLTAYGTTAGDTTGATDVRVKEIGVLLDKVEEFTKAGYTVFLTGDMNSTSSGTEYKTLTATLSDTRKLASTTTDEVTFHNYGNGNARTIDYCFVSVGANLVRVESYAVEKTYNNKYLSDHSALIVTATVARTAVNG
jgi:endonuclease/exonuclease/phosphatase family metal-dependent hydrolase